MDKIVNKKVEQYITSFKTDISNKINELSFSEKDKLNNLLEYIFDYHRLSFTKDDMIKRKRVKNSIPDLNRCNAKRANGEQCTRRRKEECELCGTHMKGVPYGLVLCQTATEIPVKVEIIAEEISGIVYYIDYFGNVYKTEDILEDKVNPQIVAKYEKTSDNRIHIPSFGI
jgi:hypothetical protein